MINYLTCSDALIMISVIKSGTLPGTPCMPATVWNPIIIPFTTIRIATKGSMYLQRTSVMPSYWLLMWVVTTCSGMCHDQPSKQMTIEHPQKDSFGHLWDAY